MRTAVMLGSSLAVLMLPCLAVADVLPRKDQAAGAVIARRSGEEAKFIELPTWRVVDISQDVVPGDVLRTNASGNLAVLFSDRTQMRFGRNTTLLVKRVGAAGDSEFELQSGTMWARAKRGGAGLKVDTPAAAASIRGTDWTMTVKGDTTSLIVLEGNIDFSNPQGSLSLSAGQAASATIGSAPARTVNVNPDDRQQMLFYFSLRNAGDYLPSSDRSSRALYQDRARLAAIPESARTAEDWLALAEARQSYDGLAQSRVAADRARVLPLNDRQRARLDLLDAFQANDRREYKEAAALFSRAAQRLDADRRSVALYAAFIARSLADPELREQPPELGNSGPGSALARALYLAYAVGYNEAIAQLSRDEQAYPDDATLPAARARFAMLVNDVPQAEAAIDRALRLDPDNPTALEARAYLRADFRGDLDAAYEDARRVVEIAPGQATGWNMLGNLETERGGVKEAVAAFERAIELSPRDPVSRANLAFLYLENQRMADAKREIDQAIADDPSFDVALIARGRYQMQSGNLDAAVEDLLAGTTANPSYAQGLLLLAATYYERGELVAAQQALDNADRLDANDPAAASIRTAMAVDAYDADLAVASAQETLRRTRAKGGNFESLGFNQDAGSTLNAAYRLLELNAWGRYYGDAVFDPFSASGYFDQSSSGSANPFVNNLRFGDLQTEPQNNDTSYASRFQGYLLDPQYLSGPNRRIQLVKRPFFETEVGGGVTLDRDGRAGWNGTVTAQGFDNSTMPTSVYATISGLENDTLRGASVADGQFGLNDESLSGQVMLGISPTLSDRLIAFAEVSHFEFGLDTVNDATTFPTLAAGRAGDTQTVNAGVGWSHTFGYRNVANVAFLATDLRDTSSTAASTFLAAPLPPFPPGVFDVEQIDDFSQRTYLGGFSHLLGIGDVTFRYGAEAGVSKSVFDRTVTITTPIGELPDTGTVTDDLDLLRGHLDALWQATPDLSFEAGLFGTKLSSGTVDVDRLEPRVGMAWSPIDGQYLRVGYLRESPSISTATLAPIGVVGLQSNRASLSPQGDSESIVARWDAEWTSRFFTSLDYQHQSFNDLSIQLPTSGDTIRLSDGTVSRLSATANVWLGGGLGAFASYAWTESSNDDPFSAGYRGDLAFIPEHSARFGMTYVHPSNVKATVAATYVGNRNGDEVGTRLAGYWTADAFLTWEPFNKRLELELAAYNLFDEEFEVEPLTAGWGRSFVGSMKIRF